ncbi:MAG: hypothetical protein H0W02_02795 [Ktedonobacteraceae bacterium]|nr:hypothetical protein [Ktedonobacteraceae bacterium]
MATQQICQVCGAVNVVHARFCTHCGKALHTEPIYFQDPAYEAIVSASTNILFPRPESELVQAHNQDPSAALSAVTTRPLADTSQSQPGHISMLFMNAARNVSRASGQQRTQLTRLLWTTLVITSLLLYIASIPGRYNDLLLIDAGNQKMILVQGYFFSQLATFNIVFEVITVFTSLGAALLIFWHRADDRLALFIAFILVLYGIWIVRPMDALSEANQLLYFLLCIIRALEQTLLVIACCVFPKKRFTPGWTLPVSIVWGLINLTWLLFPTMPFNGVYPVAPHALLPTQALLISLPFYGTGLFAQISHYRHTSDSIQRQQAVCITTGITIAALIILLLKLYHHFSSSVDAYYYFALPIYYLFSLAIPLAFGIAILRYQLWDINLVLNRALVYGGLTASVVTLYILLVGGISILFQSQRNLFVSLLATGIVALLFQPLRNYLQHGADRLLYGQRKEPYKVLSRLGKRLEGTFAPEEVLSTIVQTIALALKLPYTAISLKQAEDSSFRIAVSYGQIAEKNEISRFPLKYQGEHIGMLELAPRTPGDTFTQTDIHLLEDLARQAGVAAHAVRLTLDLQRARENLILAREDERDRLSRDLHDGGLSPLNALTLKLGSARTLIQRDPTGAEQQLKEAESILQRTVSAVRQVVRSLRPPILDEIGLVAAIQEYASQCQMNAHPDGTGDGHKLSIVVRSPHTLPPLSKAVEVATYFIVQEALTNVIRHAHARTCCVQFQVSGKLFVEIIDDGIGLPATWRKDAIGIRSMRERAMEVGGTCEILPSPTGGTCIRCSLPLIDGHSTH